MTVKQYVSVNGKWPEGTNEGRNIVPTSQEAISACKRLYKRAMGKPFPGTFKLTSGRKYTWIRNHVFYVNPNHRGCGGWHEIIHMVSHLCAQRLFSEGHGPRHASLERDMVCYAMEQGWLNGTLQRKSRTIKPPVDPKAVKIAKINARIQRWESKRKRAENALRKLERTRKRLNDNHQRAINV